MPENQGGIGRALKSRNFAFYCAGMTASLNGSFVFVVALGWLTWELTGSAAWIGTIVLLETLPAALVGPLAGAVIDRMGSRRVLFTAQSLAAANMALLAAVTMIGQISIEDIIVFAVLQGLINGASFPGHFALLPKLLPRTDMAAGIAVQSAVAHSARFTGPALAGGILLASGPGMAFAFNSASYLAFLGALAFIRVDEGNDAVARAPQLLRDLAEAFRHLLSHGAMTTMLVLAVAGAIFIRPLSDLMPAVVGALLEGGPGTLAWLLSSAGAGALAAALWLAQRGHMGGLTHIMLAGFAAAALAIIIFLSGPATAMGIPLMFAFGFGTSVTAVANQTLVQNLTEDRMRARIMGFYGLTVRALPALGAFVMGGLAAVFGLAPTLGAGAVLGLLALLWIWVRVRRGNFIELVETEKSDGRAQ